MKFYYSKIQHEHGKWGESFVLTGITTQEH